ncbi:hypothetical protein [Streptosporangium sp. NPDC049644]|uniref:hypothetical protein n=1 Tax=Streptosporangium sp. NPDC049644 TaxID=3155507 RepID=UPI003413DD28
MTVSGAAPGTGGPGQAGTAAGVTNAAPPGTVRVRPRADEAGPVAGTVNAAPP